MQATHNPARDQAGTPTRRVDGRPETDADRRFFDLREAGYTGPIDQDGHPVTSSETGTLAAYEVAQALHRRHGDPFDSPCQNPETPGRTLRRAADYLVEHGWIQGAYYDATGGSFTPSACMVGAIGMVCYGGPVDAPAQMFDDPGFGRFEKTLAHLDGFLTDRFGLVSYEFNDMRGRSFEAVVYALLKAADKWSLAHQEHADYPHEPGNLYDCPVCEAECFCRDGFTCVHCAIEAEGDLTPGGAV